MPVQQMKNLSHPENWKLKANYPYPTVQIDGCPSKQYDRVVSYWFRRGSEQFDKLGKVIAYTYRYFGPQTHIICHI